MLSIVKEFKTNLLISKLNLFYRIGSRFVVSLLKTLLKTSSLAFSIERTFILMSKLYNELKANSAKQQFCKMMQTHISQIKYWFI